MKNITNKTKTILFASLIAAMILPFSGMMMAEAAPNADKTTQQTVDQIGEQTILLLIENQQLEANTDSVSLEKIADNNQRISELYDQMREAVPKVKRVGISDNLMKDMKYLESQLWASDLPVYLTVPNTKTGQLDVYIDSSSPSIGMSERIQSISSDIPINIVYEKSMGNLQLGSCDVNGVFCDPIVGGADGKDKFNGKPCTVSIGATKGSTNGIVIPRHCDPNSSDYHQSLTGSPSHKVGGVDTQGWWYCDCEFVKSDSRTVSQTKVTLGSSDYTISGRSNFAEDDVVFLYGAISGWDWGIVENTGMSWQPGPPAGTGPTFDHLYGISGISFTDGDSGAPAIDYYAGNYGGMNIGTTATLQMVHEWSHIKWNLGLD